MIWALIHSLVHRCSILEECPSLLSWDRSNGKAFIELEEIVPSALLGAVIPHYREAFVMAGGITWRILH